MREHRDAIAAGVLALALAVLGAVGCERESAAPKPPAAPPAAAAAGSEYCDFQGGPQEAAVQVVAYYPGRHEDTLAAVKSLLETFAGKVRVEIVDWRREEGLQRRDAAGLTCAGITINGKNTFDLTVEGKPAKVLFVKGIGGEWTRADLEAAVRQEIASAGAGKK